MLLALAAHAQDTAAAECSATLLSDDDVSVASKNIVRPRSSAVILRLTYSSPDEAPAVETIYAGGDSRFAEEVLAQVRKLRTPCALPERPASQVQWVRMVAAQQGFEQYERRLERELKLADVVRNIKQTKRQPVQIDTRLMRCPFRLAFAPFQPYLPNKVRDPQHYFRRLPLVRWLESITLNIPDEMMPSAIGQESFITVPCAVLDLS